MQLDVQRVHRIPDSTARFMARAILTESSAAAIAVFINTPSYPNSMPMAASEAVPTPASTITGTCVLIRRAWLGEPPRAEVDRQVDVYRGYASTSATAHWGADEMALGASADEVAKRLVDACESAGADALNLRVHVPGVTVDAARDQIMVLGDQVVPLVKAMRT